ncbi:hypothetical protein [Micromonospora sp. CB01531]|uniref:hypothetical protein n=1 Tax=Micromonospora sp. CB01531 TaxID=1718947 RepID=UPI000A6C4C60|nr:hypothetical protein [Micromonospora sp. CB01531]
MVSLNAGNGIIKGKSKQFAIDHPLDPPDATERRQLIQPAGSGSAPSTARPPRTPSAGR